MLVLTPTAVALCIVVPLLAYFVTKWLFEKDTEIENRRRAAAVMAGKLQAIGLKKLPEFLVDYSVGDYSGMANKIQSTAELFLNGEGAVLAEVDTVFYNVLTAKLKSEEGRAFIAAKLADTAPPAAPTIPGLSVSA